MAGDNQSFNFDINSFANGNDPYITDIYQRARQLGSSAVPGLDLSQYMVTAENMRLPAATSNVPSSVGSNSPSALSSNVLGNRVSGTSSVLDQYRDVKLNQQTIDNLKAKGIDVEKVHESGKNAIGMPSAEIAETVNLTGGSLEELKALYNGFCGIMNHDMVSEHDILYRDNPQIETIDSEVTEEQKQEELYDAMEMTNKHFWGHENGMGFVKYYPMDAAAEELRGQINYYAMADSNQSAVFNLYLREHNLSADTTEITILEYDPKTGKPTGNKKTLKRPTAPIGADGKPNYTDRTYLNNLRAWQGNGTNPDLTAMTNFLLASTAGGKPENDYPAGGTDKEKEEWLQKHMQENAAYQQIYNNAIAAMKDKSNWSMLGQVDNPDAYGFNAVSGFLYDTDPDRRLEELNKQIPHQRTVVAQADKDAADAKKRKKEEDEKKRREEQKKKEEEKKAEQKKKEEEQKKKKEEEEKKKKEEAQKKGVTTKKKKPKKPTSNKPKDKEGDKDDDKKKDSKKGNKGSDYGDLPEVQNAKKQREYLAALEAERNALSGSGHVTVAQAKKLGIDPELLSGKKDTDVISAADYKNMWLKKQYKQYGATSEKEFRDKWARQYADELEAYAMWLNDKQNSPRARSTNIVDVRKDIKNKVNTKFADKLMLTTPGWGYDEFINERNIFQKSLYTGVTEQGWWYFKIFFNFDTQYGLLGGILNNNGKPMSATNSAYMYLQNVVSRGQFERVMARKDALVKFVRILAYINSNAPWFFKDVKNLNQANVPIMDGFSKEKSIEIGCREDSIDMRLTTLLDLYKFVTYDEINQKEILPENLRKFDMSVILFQVPLRYFHTAFVTSDGESFPYKNLNGDPSTGFANMMSFKMFSFINCEIDINSLGSMIPSSVSNEKPFTMGGGSIKITYDRVYTHTMNEFNKIMFGSDGFHYNGNKGNISKISSNIQDRRVKAINKHMIAADNKGSDGLYKGMVDASEYLCSHRYMGLGLDALGNIAGAENKSLLGKKENGKLIFDPNDYVKLKLKLLKSTNKTELLNVLNEVHSDGDIFIQNLIDSYRKYLSDDNQWIAGAQNTDINTAEGARYWEDKIKALKGKNIFRKFVNKTYSRLFNTSVGSVKPGNPSKPLTSSEPITSRIQDSIANSLYYMDKIRDLKNGTNTVGNGGSSPNPPIGRRRVASASMPTYNNNNAGNRAVVSNRELSEYTPAPINAFGAYEKVADIQQATNNTTRTTNAHITTSSSNNIQDPNSDYYINKLRELKKHTNTGKSYGGGGRDVAKKNLEDNETFFNKGKGTDISSHLMRNNISMDFV